MTTKPQTKFNAKRSAETATRRTGIEHTIVEAEGGWVAAASEGGEAATAPRGLEAFTREVTGFLAEEGCEAIITEEDEIGRAHV